MTTTSGTSTRADEIQGPAEVPSSSVISLAQRTGIRLAAGAFLVLELAAATLGAAGVEGAAMAIAIGLVITVAGAGAWLTIIDVRTRLLPNAIVYPLGVVAAGGALSIAIATSNPSLALWSLIGAATLGLVYLVLGLAGAVGLGDIKLAVVLGACLGLGGWEALVGATVLTYLLALPEAVIVAVRSRSFRSSLAFGPYLIAGAVVAGVVTLVFR